MVTVKDLKHVRLPELSQGFLDSIGVDTPELLRAGRSPDPRTADPGRAAHGHARARLLTSCFSARPSTCRATWFRVRRRTPSSDWWRDLKREGMTDRSDPSSRGPDPRQRARGDVAHRSRKCSCSPRSPRPSRSRSKTTTYWPKCRRSPTEPARVSAASARAVEKEGGAESLATQILEQRVIDRITETIAIEDVAVAIEPEGRVETLDITATKPAAETPAMDEASRDPE